MKSKIILLLIGIASFSRMSAQTGKPAVPQIDVNALMKMTPEERQKYAAKMQKQLTGQASEMADKMDISFDASTLPGFTLRAPVKDLKKLAAIPATPPNRQQMLANVSKMEAALRKVVAPEVVKDVEQFSASKSVKEIQQAAVGGWYANNPQGAMLLNMKAVQKGPEDVTSWNNLAVQYTQTGMEHMAVPILQNLLGDNPNSSILLNNMGQAFFMLGELNKANQYLQRCLEIDELHPEANRSMGMIKTIANDLAGAAKYFEKEMMVVQRKSTLAQWRNNAEAKKFNLAALRKKKMQLDGVDKLNYFEEINLGKFKIPDLPMNTDAARTWWDEHAGFAQSLMNEMMFWNEASQVSKEEIEADGKRYHGRYHDLVNILLSELGDDFSHILGLVTEDESKEMISIVEGYYKKYAEMKCPEAPAGSGSDVQLAYQKKCCDIKKPITDAYLAEYNSFISQRIHIVQARWKEYINGMVSIVQLDPSLANKIGVYRTVQAYFAFLMACMQAVKVDGPPIECMDMTMTTKEADSILATKKDYDIKCPEWAKINLSLKVAKLKADCNSFNVEADIYKLIHVGMTKTFKTGASTLYVGAGVDGKFFKNVLSGKVQQQFYIVFDNNNEFADLGMRGTGSFNIANGLFGETFTYDFSMSSGFNSNLTPTSDWMKKVQQAVGFLN